MNRLNHLKKATAVCFVALGFTWLVPSGTVKAVNPPPDGGYSGHNTAEGEEALFKLKTTAKDNTAIGSHALFSTTTGNDNTAIGSFALNANITGSRNTGTGSGSLIFNDTGRENTATGFNALNFNDSGSQNTAIGAFALENNEIGNGNTAIGFNSLQKTTAPSGNTAIGFSSLEKNTTGERNTAIGLSSLDKNTTGSFNVALGAGAGSNVSTADDVICIGRAVDGANVSGTCFIGNIRGVTTQNANALPVVIDGAGQLGTVASSERFKKDIAIMGQASEAILSLRPVTFHYRTDTKGVPQFGLIAEEVAKVNPALVLPDKEGKPYTVRYDAVNAMLLNEFLKEHSAFMEEQRKVEILEATVAQQHKDFEAVVNELNRQIQKLSAQLELNKSTPQTVCLPVIALREGGNN